MSLRLFALALVLAAPVGAQIGTQIIPQSTGVTAGIGIPLDLFGDGIGQFHYDSSEFVEQGPMWITQLWIRPSFSSGSAPAFSIDGVEVTLIEASTDRLSRSPVFADNVLRAEVVRSGRLVGGPHPAPQSSTDPGEWVSLDCVKPFFYDPSSGNDLIVQVRKCANGSIGFTYDTAFDFGGSSPVAYAFNSLDCNGITATGTGPGAPRIRIAYVAAAAQTLPAGFETTEGTSSTSFPVNTSNDQIWQWFYDSSEFVTQEPIVIDEIWIRSNNGASVIPFSFGSFDVRMGQASVDVTAVSPVFSDNVSQDVLVRGGPWSGGPAGATPSGQGAWVPFGLQSSFVYDPSSGQDFFIQMTKCGTTSTFGTSIDGTFGAAVTRNGHQSSCTSNVADLVQTFAPIVRIRYRPLALDRVLPFSDPTPPISALPWFEDFTGFPINGALPGWTNDAVDGVLIGNWSPLTDSGTSSGGTGPSNDHTTGDGTYVYVEDSGQENTATNLLTPTFDLTALEHPTLLFRVHSLNGSATIPPNLLAIDVIHPETGAVHLDVRPVIAETGDRWQRGIADLTPYAGDFLRVRFRGRTDNGTFVNDIAIDDVVIVSGGTRDDLDLTVEIADGMVTDAPVKTAQAGDLFRWTIESPDGALDGGIPLLIGQVYPDGAPPASTLLDEIYMSFPGLQLFFTGFGGSPFGDILLTAQGVSLAGPLPGGLGPFTLILQALVSSPFANNGALAVSAPMVIDFN